MTADLTPSTYSIIRVTPDPVRGEAVNIGAIVVNDSEGVVQVGFAKKDRELHALAPDLDLSFLRDLERSLKKVAARKGSQLALDGSEWALGEADLNRFHTEYGNVVQYSEPGASVQPPDELLQYVLSRFVAPHRESRRPASYRDKGMLKRRVTRQFKQLGLADRVDRDVVVRTNRAACVFDYGLRLNGAKLSRAVRTLSLEAQEKHAAAAARDALHAFVFDAGEVQHRVPVSLVAYLPAEASELAKEASRLVADLDRTELVSADDVPGWARSLAAKVRQKD